MREKTETPAVVVNQFVGDPYSRIHQNFRRALTDSSVSQKTKTATTSFSNLLSAWNLLVK